MQEISCLEAVQDNALQGDVLAFQICRRQAYMVQRAQSCIRHQKTREMLGQDKVRQRKNGGFVMAQGTEDAAGAFNGDEIVFSTKNIVCFLYLFPFDGISFYLRRQMRGNSGFVYIRAHILKGLGNARSGFHKVRVTGQKRTIRKTDIAAHCRFEIGGFFAVFL